MPQISRKSHTKLYYRNRVFIVWICRGYRGVSVLLWSDINAEVYMKHVTRCDVVLLWDSKIDKAKDESESV